MQRHCRACRELARWGSLDLCRLHRNPETMEEILWQQAKRAGLRPVSQPPGANHVG